MSLKIIVVEDNFIIQMFLEEVALNMGHEVLVSTDNGEDVLKLLNMMQPDVILLDIGITGKHSVIEIAEILNENTRCHLFLQPEIRTIIQ